jgi:hypothetical protein
VKAFIHHPQSLFLGRALVQVRKIVVAWAAPLHVGNFGGFGVAY